ncbi:MAG: aminotransferase class I/II-fold pyridoxal phosphate-dependent enzyme [Deltaproteobacteria bacterium]|nr:aminotransferase class I/II-fold pyridoxal phosphate-dependent enzyme [Deltaproteobacteria bacterium]
MPQSLMPVNTCVLEKDPFSDLPVFPPDEILNLAERYKNDPRKSKKNCSLGIYVNQDGKVVQPQVFREIDTKLAQIEYLPIDGEDKFLQLTNEVFLNGLYHPCAQTLGSSYGLRLALEFLFRFAGITQAIVQTPAWPNYLGILDAIGYSVKKLDYLNENGNADITQLLEVLSQIRKPVCVIFQVGCHNPTGVDLSPQQIKELNDFILRHYPKVMLIADFCYAGFRPLNLDLEVLKLLSVPHFLSFSYSKNAGLYSRRTGGLYFIGPTDHLDRITGCLRKIIRSTYSSPPIDGAYMVTQVLSNPEMKSRWFEELASYRERLTSLRQAFSQAFGDPLSGIIKNQNGLFSFIHKSFLREELRESKKAQELLIERHGIYTVQLEDGLRINLAGLKDPNSASEFGLLLNDQIVRPI